MLNNIKLCPGIIVEYEGNSPWIQIQSYSGNFHYNSESYEDAMIHQMKAKVFNDISALKIVYATNSEECWNIHLWFDHHVMKYIKTMLDACNWNFEA